jgi:ABC-type polysaccharide/polyol phosphate transport system ATPase subunit
MEEKIVISIRNLNKSYPIFENHQARLKELLLFGKKSFHKNFFALKDLSLDIIKGECIGIIGRNGSGKSTLLQIICGTVAPSSGIVEINGIVSALLELGSGFNPDFTGKENIYMNGKILGLSKDQIDERYDDIISFADIGEFINQPLKTYSSGMQVRLAFAIAVSIEPDILVIDEALAVGDDSFKRRCYQKIEDFKNQKKTILFVSHDLKQVLSICDTAILLEKGETIEIGTPKDVVNTYGKLLAENEASYSREVARKSWVGRNINQVSISKNSNIQEFRYGSKDASIIQIKIKGEDSVHTTTLIKGNKYTFEVEIVFHKDILKPAIGVSIITLSGIEICGTSTIVTDYPVPAIKANSKILTKFIQYINLNPGAYSVNVSVASILADKRIFLDRRLDMIIFKVIGISKSYGFIDLNSEISIEII